MKVGDLVWLFQPYRDKKLGIVLKSNRQNFKNKYHKVLWEDGKIEHHVKDYNLRAVKKCPLSVPTTCWSDVALIIKCLDQCLKSHTVTEPTSESCGIMAINAEVGKWHLDYCVVLTTRRHKANALHRWMIALTSNRLLTIYDSMLTSALDIGASG